MPDGTGEQVAIVPGSHGGFNRINDHATLGIARQEDTGAMMVKAVGEQAWPEGDVDLLGHVF